MPYNLFTSVRLMDDRTLRVSGKSDAAAIDCVEAIHVAIIGLQDDAKRIPGVPDKLIAGWHVSVANTPPARFEPFAIGESVVLVGSETHTATVPETPFLWHGLFEIVSEHDRSTGELDPSCLTGP